jgi:hypothetical protein
MYDISQLSPEEKDRLLQMLIEKAGIQPGSGTHEDAQEDAAQLEPLVKVIEMLCDKFEALEERVEALDKLVTEEIIGGITTLYNEKSRLSGISGITEKYKDKFDPYKDFYSEVAGGDLYEKLYDEIQSMKEGREDWNDEEEGAKVGELAEMLGGKFNKIKGIGAPTAVEVEIQKTEAPQDDGLSKIRSMRSKFGDKNLG